MTGQPTGPDTWPVAIALGSNLGDRQGHLDWAVTALGSFVVDLRVSPYLETEPIGVPDAQPPYLNAVVVGKTALEPEALLDALLALERSRGRTRPGWPAARTLDLDLILFDDRVLDGPRVVVPHPRFRERPFVVGPLAELAPDWVDPGTGLRISELVNGVNE